MTENNEENRTRAFASGKPQNMDIEIKIDRSAELEDKQREIDELKQTLTQIAERTLNEKCDRFNIDKSLSNEQKISKIRDAELSRSNTALLNEQQIYGSKLPLDKNDQNLPVDMQSFSDEYSLVSSLEQQANNGSVEAKKALSQLYSKATEKSWAYDYEGDPKDLYKKLPKNATEKERQELNDKRRLWSKVK